MDITTDFTTMTRDDIREYLTIAIGDAELPEDVRESIMFLIEDRDDLTIDEFWEIVGDVFADTDQ